jgi:hypothetical protein
MKRTKDHFCRTNRVIDLLRELPDRQFRMDIFCTDEAHKCNTVGCIGGWTWLLFKDELKEIQSKDGMSAPYMDIGEHIFGLNTVDSCNLFYATQLKTKGKNSTGLDHLPFIEKSKAIRVLENLQLSGKVDWNA